MYGAVSSLICCDVFALGWRDPVSAEASLIHSVVNDDIVYSKTLFHNTSRSSLARLPNRRRHRICDEILSERAQDIR
ncbi:hypothetical protein M405DRAFT_829209 [Rhizopogon salebrosus TDB-379]|nr:hypothetical protein M405DRAFT_829209 [Rhizopogon salebrosus TDB-379]